ncbi:MAG: CoA-binding protein [Acidimicrobiia bacterium]|nr:CoA-binding protein [Acidimicrobiia bacterium]
MMTIKEAAADFLAQKRIAVAGVSRNPQGHGSNIVYQRLRDRGYEVFAVNPNAGEVEGDKCYPNLSSIPGGVDGVVIGTSRENAAAVMRDAVSAGITRVWMHRSFGAGSVSQDATVFGRDNEVMVIDGGCPLMFDPTADFGHKCMRPIFTMMGAVPKKV